MLMLKFLVCSCVNVLYMVRCFSFKLGLGLVD